MSLPTPIPGDPAGLKEEAGLRGSAHPYLLGADSRPLHGGL